MTASADETKLPAASAKLLNDCFATDRERLTHAEALALILANTRAVTAPEAVPLDFVQCRILAQELTAARPIPAFDNSAVDGYAFAHADYDPAKGTQFIISGRAAAGHALSTATPRGSAVRIFTGAAMPQGTDSVVMQEDVQLLGSEAGGWVRVPAGLKPGANRRLAGEDAERGRVVVPAGRRLRPQDIAAAASAGAAELTCFRPLRVGLLSSGDEIVKPGGELSHGQVFDANGPMLHALTRSAGAVATSLGVTADNRQDVTAALAAAAAEHDLIITTGGASQGDEDHLAAALEAIGHRHLWQIAVKPGRPMFFGQIGDTVVIGLPGNPVAVFVCFLLYAQPLMARLAGENWQQPVRFKVRAGFDFPGKKTGRREFWRATLRANGDGLVVDKYPRDGSGLISSLTGANGLIEVGEDVTDIHAGDEVDFIPFSAFGIM